MKELLIYIAKNLVNDPDAVNVTETVQDSEVVFQLRVAPDDMGKVIGRHGRIAKEIRTLMKAAGNRENKKVTVDIVDGSFQSRSRGSFFFRKVAYEKTIS